MPDHDYDAVRAAIGVMTAWADSSDSSLAARTFANEADSEVGMDRLAIGLVNLAGMLLTVRQAEMGQTPAQSLQFIASRPWNLRSE